MKYLFLILPFFVLAQTPQVDYYDDGTIYATYFLKDKTVDSTFVVYYKNGRIKAKGQYKKCEYETNFTSIYRYGCGVGRYFDEEKKILNGKSHGKWTYFYEDGTLESVSNYHCGIEQGSFIYYHPDGSINYSQFYHKGYLLTERDYYKNGVLNILKQYSYEYLEKEDHFQITLVETEFREDSTVKSIKETIDYEEDDAKGIYKEYYPNGFLKMTEELLGDFRHGVYRTFYENGNKKYEGEFDDEERIKKHYYYAYSGEMTKIESWEADKLISTEYIEEE
jgi:antitoxin component YwqK of YwqJK toxin-antitoxin module